MIQYHTIRFLTIIFSSQFLRRDNYHNFHLVIRIVIYHKVCYAENDNNNSLLQYDTSPLINCGCLISAKCKVAVYGLSDVGFPSNERVNSAANSRRRRISHAVSPSVRGGSPCRPRMIDRLARDK